MVNVLYASPDRASQSKSRRASRGRWASKGSLLVETPTNSDKWTSQKIAAFLNFNYIY